MSQSNFCTEETISHWKDFLAKAQADVFLNSGQNYFQWIFRADKPTDELLSSFDKSYRCAHPSKPPDEYERIMLREFKRAVHHYQPHIPDEDDYLEWLALARHYGMPCRLMDFTYSIYIAAYMALAGKSDDQDGIIWAINLEWLKKKTKERFPDLDIQDKKASRIF